MKSRDDSLKVTGLLYQQTGSTDTQLVGGLANSIRLFKGVPMTGFTYREENSHEDKLASGLHVTGIVWRASPGSDEQILRSDKLRGVIFQSRRILEGDKGSSAENVDRSGSKSLQQRPLLGSTIVGIVCSDQDTGEEQLTSTAQTGLKILSGEAISGIVFEGAEGEIIKRLAGSEITGLLFQQPNSGSETILSDLVILGMIFQEKATSFSLSAVSLVTRSALYVILILGVLGLLLPAVRTDSDFSSLNFIALPLTVVSILLLLMVAVPIILLVYGRFRRLRSLPPI